MTKACSISGNANSRKSVTPRQISRQPPPRRCARPRPPGRRGGCWRSSGQRCGGSDAAWPMKSGLRSSRRFRSPWLLWLAGVGSAPGGPSYGKGDKSNTRSAPSRRRNRCSEISALPVRAKLRCPPPTPQHWKQPCDARLRSAYTGPGLPSSAFENAMRLQDCTTMRRGMDVAAEVGSCLRALTHHGKMMWAYDAAGERKLKADQRQPPEPWHNSCPSFGFVSWRSRPPTATRSSSLVPTSPAIRCHSIPSPTRQREGPR